MHDVIANITIVIKFFLDKKQEKKVYGYSLFYDRSISFKKFVELGKRKDKFSEVLSKTGGASFGCFLFLSI